MMLLMAPINCNSAACSCNNYVKCLLNKYTFHLLPDQFCDETGQMHNVQRPCGRHQEHILRAHPSLYEKKEEAKALNRNESISASI